MGRGVKGTGLRRPHGALYGKSNWKRILKDAKETGLIERDDDNKVEDKHEYAHWIVTEKGKDIFNEIARCETCGEPKTAYKFIRTYQTHGRYKNKDTRLKLACSTCDKLNHTLSSMTISSSSGSYKHKEL